MFHNRPECRHNLSGLKIRKNPVAHAELMMDGAFAKLPPSGGPEDQDRRRGAMAGARALICGAGLMLAGCLPLPGPGDGLANRHATAPVGQALPVMKSFAATRPAPLAHSNAQIALEFLDLSFQMESGRRIDRLSRFEGPVRITIAPGAPETLGFDLDRLITRLRQEAGIDIRRVGFGAGVAHITIETLPRAQLQRAVPHAACFVVPRVSSWADFRRARNSRAMDWTTLERREQVAIFIPNDVAPQEIRDCLHEEVAQALGPLNDLYHLHDSVFNDDNFHAVLTGFDMLILRAYYDPALRSGMTRAEVAARLPEVLDRLNPGGAGGGAIAHRPSPRAWVDAIETALGPGTRDRQRRVAAAQAVALARQADLSDARLAFSYFALGRLSLDSDPETALNAFLTARGLYDRIAPGEIHAAHVDLQIAGLAMHAGRHDDAILLARRAAPIATRAENAALLSMLLMVEAQALAATGQIALAREARVDSLAWGRYGFGTTAQMGGPLAEMAALSP